MRTAASACVTVLLPQTLASILSASSLIMEQTHTFRILSVSWQHTRLHVVLLVPPVVPVWSYRNSDSTWRHPEGLMEAGARRAFYTVNYVTEMYFLIFTVYICNRVWPWFCPTLLKCFFQTLFAFFSIVALSSIFSYNTTNDRAEDTHRWKQCTALPCEGTTS